MDVEDTEREGISCPRDVERGTSAHDTNTKGMEEAMIPDNQCDHSTEGNSASENTNTEGGITASDGNFIGTSSSVETTTFVTSSVGTSTSGEASTYMYVVSQPPSTCKAVEETSKENVEGLGLDSVKESLLRDMLIQTHSVPDTSNEGESQSMVRPDGQCIDNMQGTLISIPERSEVCVSSDPATASAILSILPEEALQEHQTSETDNVVDDGCDDEESSGEDTHENIENSAESEEPVGEKILQGMIWIHVLHVCDKHSKTRICVIHPQPQKSIIIGSVSISFLFSCFCLIKSIEHSV